MSILAPPPSTHIYTHTTRPSTHHLPHQQHPHLQHLPAVHVPNPDSPSGSGHFAASGAATSHAELPPTLAQPSLPVPFPSYTQRHTSPYPMSFSSLGTGPLTPEQSPLMSAHGLPLHASQPPTAPKVELNDLPVLSPDLSSSPELDPMTAPIQVYDYAIRPRPSFRVLRPKTSINGKLVPDTMVKLAPPADEMLDYAFQQPTGEVQTVVVEPYEEAHRRAVGDMGARAVKERPQSLISPSPTAVIPGEEGISATSVGRSRSDGNKKSNGRKSMGPPPRPKRASTAYPGQLPTSANMQPSSSADSRQRLRNSMVGMPPRTHTFHSQPSSAHSTISRGIIDVASPARPFALAAGTGVSDEEEPDLGGPEGLEAKVVLLGSQGAGKTSLILRYTTRTFTANSAPATIGSSLHTRKLVHAGTRVKLQIWDTAGQERFRSMAPIYYRGAHVCVLVYDIADRQSFEDVRSWLEELGRTVPKETVIYVVGQKTDLEGSQRVVSFEEARRNIRLWTRPPSPPMREEMLPPPTRSLLRSPSVSAGTDQPRSSTPTRSYSQTALSSYDHSTRSLPNSAAGTPARQISIGHSNKAAKPSIKVKGARPSLTSPTSPRGVHFPALQSPTRSTQATTTEHVRISSPPPNGSRHGASAGRYSISGMLGISRTESMSGAALNLARLAEENPTDTSRRSASPLGGRPPYVSPRIRTESSPLLHSSPAISGRRQSEEWSSRSWRMGEGPSAAEALGEFGAGVRRRESGELLSRSNGSAGSGGPVGGAPSSASGISSHSGTYGLGQSQSLGTASGTATTGYSGYGGSHSAVSTPGTGSAGVTFPPYGSTASQGGASTPGSTKGTVHAGGSLGRSRSRGGSLGSASRLYLSENEEEKEWGVDVGGIRLGECSALTGDGVEALFRSISSHLVQKKDKIERDRDMRRQGSVMLTDMDLDREAAAGGKSRANCCI